MLCVSCDLGIECSADSFALHHESFKYIVTETALHELFSAVRDLKADTSIF